MTNKLKTGYAKSLKWKGKNDWINNKEKLKELICNLAEGKKVKVRGGDNS